MLFGKLAKGGAVKVSLKDDKLEFEYTSATPSPNAKAEGDGDEGTSEREPETAE